MEIKNRQKSTSPSKNIPKAFFFSTFYYTFRGVSDLCFASEFPMSLSEVVVALQKRQ